MVFKYKKSNVASIDVLILTPILVEYRAVRSMLQNTRNFTDSRTSRTYCLGEVRQRRGSLKIALRKTDKGHLAMMENVQDGITILQPRFVILFGTAGGVRKVEIGDIVVGTAGYNYEFGRIVDDGFYSSPQVAVCSRRLVELAESKALQVEKWQSYLPDDSHIPRLLFGAIASGDKVIASVKAPLITQLKERYHDALALEMEAYAFLRSAHNYPEVQTLIIRGISDLLGDKEEANKNHSRELAVANAAAFLRHFLNSAELAPVSPLHKRYRWLLALTIALLVGAMTWWQLDKATAGSQQPLSSFPINQTNTTAQQPEGKATPSPPRTEPEVAQPKAEKTAPAMDTTRALPIQNASAKPTIEKELPDTTAMAKLSEMDTTAKTKPVPPTADTRDDSKKTRPLYNFKIYLFNSNRERIRDAVYYVDQQMVSLVGNKVQLTPGRHQLEIHRGNSKPLKQTINVPAYDNGQIKITWDPE